MLKKYEKPTLSFKVIYDTNCLVDVFTESTGNWSPVVPLDGIY